MLRNGWLRTGDMAFRSDAGFFHIVDRKKDMVVSGGFNVYPARSKTFSLTIPQCRWSR